MDDEEWEGRKSNEDRWTQFERRRREEQRAQSIAATGRLEELTRSNSAELMEIRRSIDDGFSTMNGRVRALERWRIEEETTAKVLAENQARHVTGRQVYLAAATIIASVVAGVLANTHII